MALLVAVAVVSTWGCAAILLVGRGRRSTVWLDIMNCSDSDSSGPSWLVAVTSGVCVVRGNSVPGCNGEGVEGKRGRGVGVALVTVLSGSWDVAGLVFCTLELVGGGASSLELGRGGASSLELGRGGASSLELGRGGASSLELGRGGVNSLELEGGGASSLELGRGGASSLELKRGGASSLELGGGGASSLEAGSNSCNAVEVASSSNRVSTGVGFVEGRGEASVIDVSGIESVGSKMKDCVGSGTKERENSAAVVVADSRVPSVETGNVAVRPGLPSEVLAARRRSDPEGNKLWGGEVPEAESDRVAMVTVGDSRRDTPVGRNSEMLCGAPVAPTPLRHYHHSCTHSPGYIQIVYFTCMPEHAAEVASKVYPYIRPHAADSSLPSLTFLALAWVEHPQHQKVSHRSHQPPHHSSEGGEQMHLLLL